MAKHVAIVLSAGRGSRMNTDVAKQYLILQGVPVICHTLKAFEESKIDEVILVTAACDAALVKADIVEKYGFSKVKKIVAGGAERVDSVYEGLKAADADYIHIHDGARCLITPELIERMMSGAEKYKAAVMAVPAKDTIRQADAEGYGEKCLDRSILWAMQTPQSFEYTLIRAAFDKMYATDGPVKITDDVMVLEQYGNKSARLVEGSYENLKITTPEDLIMAQAILDNRAQEF